MALKTILVDPKTGEVFPSSEQMVADHNASKYGDWPISIEDQNDLNEMFGIEELYIH